MMDRAAMDCGNSAGTALLCWIGQEPDPDSNYAYRWVIPVPDPCQCTEVRVAGLSTETPCRPFKVTYHKTFLHTDDKDEIRRFLNCPSMGLEVHVNLLPEDTVLSVGIQQELTFDLEFTPQHGLASLINGAGQDRYQVTGYICEDPSGSNKLVEEVVNLTPAQDAMVVTDGAVSTFSDLHVIFDLTGIDCPYPPINTHFCIEIAPSVMAANPNAGSKDCIQICCAETVDIGLKNLSVTSPDNLVIQDDGIANIKLSFNMSTAAMTNIDWWKYEVTTWLTNDQLTAGQVNIDYRSTSGTKADIRTEFDLSSVECNETFTWNVCIKVQPSVRATSGCYHWTHIPNATMTLCTPIYCVPDVQVNVVGLNVTRPEIIVDHRIVPVTFDLKFIPRVGSTSYVNNAGDDRYRVDVFLVNRYQPSLSGKKAFTQAVMPSDQMQLNISENVPEVFSGLTVDLDMRDVMCWSVRYICVELLPSLQAEKDWIQSRDAAQVHCVSVCCASSVNRNLRNLNVYQPYNRIMQDEGTVNIGLSFAISASDYYRSEVTTWLASDSSHYQLLLSPVYSHSYSSTTYWYYYTQQYLNTKIISQFDLSSVECNETLTWNVCIEVQPSVDARCYWTHSPNTATTLCEPIYCVPDVQVNIDDLDLSTMVPDYILGDDEIFPVTFDLHFTPGFKRTSHVNNAGDDRYRVIASLETRAYPPWWRASREAVLSPDQMQLNISENVPGVFSGLTVDLDMRYLTCWNVHYLCVQLLPSPAAERIWIQSRDANTSYCVSISCVAVQEINVDSVEVTQPARGIFQEGIQSNFTFDLVIPHSPRKQVLHQLGNDYLYEIRAYLSADESGILKETEDSVNLLSNSWEQSGPAYIFRDLSVSFDVTGVNCTWDISPYLCVEIGPLPDARVWTQSNQSVIMGCTVISCPPFVRLDVVSVNVTRPANLTFLSNSYQTVTFDLEFMPQSVLDVSIINGAGQDRYEVQSYLSGSAARTSKERLEFANLTQAQKSMDVGVGEVSTFQNLSVTFNLIGYSFKRDVFSHFCLELGPSAGADIGWMQFSDAVTVKCIPISCQAKVELHVRNVVVDLPPGANLLEPNLTFSITFKPSQSAVQSVRRAQKDRYAVSAYLTQGMNESIATDKKVIDLDAGQKSTVVRNKKTSTISDLHTEFDMALVNCSGRQYTHLCAELEASAAGSRQWTQSSAAITTGCFPICCEESIDIQLDNLTIDWPSAITLRDNSISGNDIDVQLNLDVSKAAASRMRAMPRSFDQYVITVWGAGNRSDEVRATTMRTERFQLQTAANGTDYLMKEVRLALDLIPVNCFLTPITQVCLSIERDTSPDRCYWNYLPSHINHTCVPATCIPLVSLEVDRLNVISPQYFIDRGSMYRSVAFDLLFTGREGSSAVVNSVGDDRYRIEVYLAKSLNGGTPAPKADADLTPSQKQQNITDGIQFEFSRVTVQLDLASVDCSSNEYKYLCAELLPSVVTETLWSQKYRSYTCVSMPCVVCHDQNQMTLSDDWRINSRPLETNFFTFAVQTDSSATFGLHDPSSLTIQVTVNQADSYLLLLLNDTQVHSVPYFLPEGMVTLWVWWHGTTFQVGSASSGQDPILSYAMPHQLAAAGVELGIKTPPPGATESWQFCNVEDGGVPPRFTYPSYPVLSKTTTTGGTGNCRYDVSSAISYSQSEFSMRFKVHAINDVHLFLSMRNKTNSKMYEISIGSAQGDTVNIVRHSSSRNSELAASAAYPWVMNFYDYASFALEVSSAGNVTVRDPERVLLAWSDPNPFPVKYFSFCTFGGYNYGFWQYEI